MGPLWTQQTGSLQTRQPKCVQAWLVPRYWLSLVSCHAHLFRSHCPVGIHPSNLHESQVWVHLPLIEADLVEPCLYTSLPITPILLGS